MPGASMAWERPEHFKGILIRDVAGDVGRVTGIAVGTE